ncbi:MAG: hypothetical protein QM639_15710 [Rhodocyclaceae bacterium]
MLSFFQSSLVSKRAALALMASVSVLAACGGSDDNPSGDLGDGGPIPDSVTISSLDGPSGGQVLQPVTLKVKVVTSGGIDASEISYKWEQTEGPASTQTQSDGNHESTLTYTPVASGTITYKVTVTARDKTASQSKSVPISGL